MGNYDYLNPNNPDDEVITPDSGVGLDSYFLAPTRSSNIQALSDEVQANQDAYQQALKRAYTQPTVPTGQALGLTFATALPLLLGAAFAGNQGAKAAAPAMMDAGKVAVGGLAESADRTQKAGLADAQAARQAWLNSQTNLQRQVDNVYDDKMLDKKMENINQNFLTAQENMMNRLNKKDAPFSPSQITAIRANDKFGKLKDVADADITPAFLSTLNSNTNAGTGEVKANAYDFSTKKTPTGEQTLTHNITLPSDTRVSPAESKDFNDMEVARSQAMDTVARMAAFTNKYGRFGSSANLSPQQQQQFGQELQRIRTGYLNMKGAMKSNNPSLAGQMSNYEQGLLQAGMPPEFFDETKAWDNGILSTMLDLTTRSPDRTKGALVGFAKSLDKGISTKLAQKGASFENDPYELLSGAKMPYENLGRATYDKQGNLVIITGKDENGRPTGYTIY